ncbi:hypothetical protein [uncultured Gammaproteobacteria bacterium]|nr:hypothetical protein [uncultured Gammaproteobacteria bacterium]CAC9652352.1 hypothetical protein [uncultured Gammaproteobacteria bacterium]
MIGRDLGFNDRMLVDLKKGGVPYFKFVGVCGGFGV